MQTRTQWTLAGTAVVLGWGAGITGGAIALNDAEKPNTFGAAVTLEAKPRAGAGGVGLMSPGAPRAERGKASSASGSPSSRPAAPRAVPAAPPKRVAATSPAPVRAPVYDASADSADSADSAASAD
jgi:hypothetical protein